MEPCVCLPPKILGQGHPQEVCHNQDIMTLQASCIYLEFTCLLDPALTFAEGGQKHRSARMLLAEVMSSFCSGHGDSTESTTACSNRL